LRDIFETVMVGVLGVWGMGGFGWGLLGRLRSFNARRSC